MKILLDCSPAKIALYRDRYQEDFGQLRTPGTNYALSDDPGVEWAADNSMYSDPDIDRWVRWVARFDENRARRPIWVALPDIVGDARRTLELFEHFKLCTNELPRALVIQDGIQHVTVPWDDIDAIFIGGTDAFKLSAEAFNVARTANLLRKKIHIGRVNTAKRFRAWATDPKTGKPLADTGDGSGMDRFDHMLEDVIAQSRGNHPQMALSVSWLAAPTECT